MCYICVIFAYTYTVCYQLQDGFSKLAHLEKLLIFNMTLYNYWLWNRLLSGFINLTKCNIHWATGEVNIRLPRLINQIATYSKVNNCFISWKCFIVIYLQIHCHTNKISQFWNVCLWFSRKTNVKRNLIGYWRTNLIR